MQGRARNGRVEKARRRSDKKGTESVAWKVKDGVWGSEGRGRGGGRRIAKERTGEDGRGRETASFGYKNCNLL